MTISQWKEKLPFRRREAEMLERLLENEAAIISPGGGIVVNPHNRALLEKNPHNILSAGRFWNLVQTDFKMTKPCNVPSF